MMSTANVEKVSYCVGQFTKLREYCIVNGIIKFGYGNISMGDVSQDLNSDYMIFMTVVGRLRDIYGKNIIRYNNDTIFYGYL